MQKLDQKTTKTEENMWKQAMNRWIRNYDKSGATEKWVKDSLFNN